MKLKAILSGLTLVLFCTVGFAQAGVKKVHVKQINQKERIKQGIKSDQLTKKEATVLRTQQKDIALTKKAAKADGIVTKKERVIIQQKQKVASKNIAEKKNNQSVKKN